MKDKSPKPIAQKRLVKMFKDIKRLKSDESRFCFLIGAGASKSSGIKTGWELSKEWYKDIRQDLDEVEREEWEKSIGFDEENIGSFYPQLYQKRYEVSPHLGYEEFKKLMESIEPGIGYVILSQILAREKHNFVITTNFDYLIEDSVRMYTTTKPFSAGHETLAEFISSQTERPTIIKVHRDLFLKPFNDDKETKKLKDEWRKALSPILKNFHLLVIGYGGNDGSLMDYLKSINVEDRKAIYWCVRNESDINDKIKDLLNAKDFIVNIKGFDELMISLNDALDFDIFEQLDEPETHPFVESAKKRITDLNDKLKDLLDKATKDKEPISEETKEIFTGAMKYLVETYEEEDEQKKNELFQKGIKEYPKDADLRGNYALFLENIRKEYDIAEKYYNEAIGIDPKSAIFKNNYALFLENIRKEYDIAEKYYKEAIELDPKRAIFRSNYALFLENVRKEYDIAEKYHKDAIKLDSNNPSIKGNYAHHLLLYKQDFLKAAVLIKQGIDIAAQSNLGLKAELWFYRYAHYKGWFDKGEKELEKLISEGAKSIGWNLQAHVDIAKKNKHPNVKKLQEFADLITK